MLLFATVLYGSQLFGLGKAVSPPSQSVFHASSSDTTISWAKCGESSGRVFECGRLSVPLDYVNPNVGEASLSIMRLLADADKRRGSIFTNPGGPAVAGTGDYQRARSLDMMEQSGGEYDIISWDARGVNDTTPKVTCFDSQELADEFWAGSPWYEGIETNSSLTSSFDLDQLYSHVDTEDARLRALWEHCESRSGEVLPYMGTAANARDVARMSDVIDGVGSEINYWGFSYGSILGQYIIALFPERLGRVIIDGVFYAPRWSVEPAVAVYNNFLISADSSYRGFADHCSQAGPDGCPLASENSTADSILADIEALLQALYNPVGITSPQAPKNSTADSIIADVDELIEVLYNPSENLDTRMPTASSVRLFIFVSLQAPRNSYPGLARYLKSVQDLVKANGEERQSALRNLEQPKTFLSHETYAIQWGIACTDGPDYDGTTTRDIFDRIVESLKHSDTIGPIWPVGGGWPCHYWTPRSVERLTNFSAKPKHPVLILANEHDPSTAIDNAYKALENNFAKGDAGLGIRAGYGHCSYSAKSSCLTTVIQDYFRDWTLPEDNMTPCPVEEDFFPLN